MQHVLRILVCLAVVALAGCSNFEKRFAQVRAAGAKGDRFAGAYSGRWSSSGHPGGGGQLRCILTALTPAGEGGPRDYRADFHATWHGFHSEHSVVFHSKPSRKGKGMRDFTGTSTLRTIIGAGTYRCEGTMDGGKIRACYDATYDKGTFEIARTASPVGKR